jgi:tol-pal system protein YbgF
MRKRSMTYVAAAMLAGALGGALLGPAPVGAVAREIVELQQSVNQLIQGQKDLQTAMAQNAAVDKTLMEQSMDTVNKMTGTMMALQKTVQDMQASSGARLDTMSTQIQGISDNLQETLARMGKLNQQLADTQNAIQGIDAKLASNAPPPSAAPPIGASGAPGSASGPAGLPPASGMPPAAAGNLPPGSAPSADLLYSNGLRDWNGKKYDLATQEFGDYLKYYGTTDLASNAQFYLGQIFYAQQQYEQAIDALSKVIDNYPKSFKLAPAHYWRALALVAIGEKTSGVSELRLVVKTYPGTDEARNAKAKLQELGVAS